MIKTKINIFKNVNDEDKVSRESVDALSMKIPSFSDDC